MYGKFVTNTMRENSESIFPSFSESKTVRRSEIRNVDFFSGKKVSKLFLAIRSADGEISIPISSSHISPQDVMMIPDPVPISTRSTFSSQLFFLYCEIIFRTRFTSTSVSSLGIRTSGVIWNFLPKNMTDPNIYSSGKSVRRSFPEIWETSFFPSSPDWSGLFQVLGIIKRFF